jgi:hypothetical protein
LLAAPPLGQDELALGPHGCGIGCGCTMFAMFAATGCSHRPCPCAETSWSQAGRHRQRSRSRLGNRSPRHPWTTSRSPSRLPRSCCSAGDSKSSPTSTRSSPFPLIHTAIRAECAHPNFLSRRLAPAHVAAIRAGRTQTATSREPHDNNHVGSGGRAGSLSGDARRQKRNINPSRPT